MEFIEASNSRDQQQACDQDRACKQEAIMTDLIQSRSKEKGSKSNGMVPGASIRRAQGASPTMHGMVRSVADAQIAIMSNHHFAPPLATLPTYQTPRLPTSSCSSLLYKYPLQVEHLKINQAIATTHVQNI